MKIVASSSVLLFSTGSLHGSSASGASLISVSSMQNQQMGFNGNGT